MKNSAQPPADHTPHPGLALTELAPPLPGHLPLAVCSRLVEVTGRTGGLVYHGRRLGGDGETTIRGQAGRTRP